MELTGILESPCPFTSFARPQRLACRQVGEAGISGHGLARSFLTCEQVGAPQNPIGKDTRSDFTPPSELVGGRATGLKKSRGASHFPLEAGRNFFPLFSRGESTCCLNRGKGSFLIILRFFDFLCPLSLPSGILGDGVERRVITLL